MAADNDNLAVAATVPGEMEGQLLVTLLLTTLVAATRLTERNSETAPDAVRTRLPPSKTFRPQRLFRL